MKERIGLVLPIKAIKIITRLEQYGYTAYVVGGAVRDWFLDRPIQDYDLATSATPTQMQEVFRDYPVLPTGIAHGTVTVLMEGEAFEVTTYRCDGTYSDGRHPDEVFFTQEVIEDLARRDFTFNAIAFHPEKGFVDPFGGIEDLRNGIVRTVGDAHQRFSEDALRIMRGLRFASVLGFSIEKSTQKQIHQDRFLLQRVAMERIRIELMKLLVGKDFQAVLRQYHDVFGVVIPELLALSGFEQQNPYHQFDIWEHTLHAMVGVSNDEVLRLTMLLHDIAKPLCFTIDQKGIGHFYGHAEKGAEMARVILNRLRFDHYTITKICRLIQFHYIPAGLNKTAVKRLVSKVGEENFPDLLTVKKADDLGKSMRFQKNFTDIAELEQIFRQIMQEGPCVKVKQLAIDGRDLLGLGYTSSPQLGKTLSALLDEVIEGQLPNQKDVLLQRAKQLRS